MRSGFLLLTLTVSGWGTLSAQGIRVPATIDTLSNGLRIIVHEDASAPIVTVDTWYWVGSGSEKPGRTGFERLNLGPIEVQKY